MIALISDSVLARGTEQGCLPAPLLFEAKEKRWGDIIKKYTSLPMIQFGAVSDYELS